MARSIVVAPQSTQACSKRKSKGHYLLLFGIAVTFCTLSYSAWMFRDYLLDDTFIHLRYAKNYLATGSFSYNLGQPSFGTSAPLYTLLLAAIGHYIPLTSWPVMAKGMSIALQFLSIIVFLSLVISPVKTRRAPTMPAYIVGVSIAALMLAVPSTSRWLQDGMETSLAVCCTLAAMVALRAWVAARVQQPGPMLMLMAGLIALVGVIRVDLLPISVAMLVLALLGTPRYKLQTLICTIVFLMIGYVAIFAVTGAVIPDSAIAKRTGMFTPGWVVDFVTAMLAVSPLWLGAPVLLLVSLGYRLVARPILYQHVIPLLCGLVPMGVTIVWGTAAGQFVHGARYFLPALIFAWAVLVCYAPDLLAFPTASRAGKVQALLLMLTVVAALIHIGVSYPALSLVRQQDSLQIDQRQRWPTMVVAAHDIGQIGWYTNARMLDLAGLVNGRMLAQTPYPERLCVAARTMGYPDAFVLTEAQSQPWRRGNTNWFEVTCSAGNTARYIKTDAPMMKHYDLDQVREWQLWLREGQ